jgi:signal transduction histidine kinase/DNA-binding NarL/FixJ family response regulator
MTKTIKYLKDRLFGGQLEFRVRLFNILAVGGVLSSLLVGVIGIINSSGIFNIITNFITAALSFAILMYSHRTGRYQICYMFTIVGIFIILFPVLFFSSGGYHSGMPIFFVFAVVFTVFMLDGKKTIFFSVFEMLLYSALCVTAYLRPEMVIHFAREQEVLTDIIMSTLIVNLVLGVCLYLHFRLYNAQQRELESAREVALAASEAKSLFLANMSHEIRTPIGVMLGMNEIIMRETDDRQIKGYSQSVENAGQQLLMLIDNILDVSAIEKGLLEITEERYETAELIAALSAVGENLTRKRDLRFETETDEALPHTLTGDMPHIRQIVSNFLNNAAKYTEQGGVTLSISALSARDGEITLQIAVSDTGIGIKEENIPHLFDAFKRGDTHGRYIEGTGLGLAIAKEYAERMGGRIFVKSELGHGSVFALELTQKVSDREPMGDWRLAKSAHSNVDAGSFTAPDCDLLVVDDNSENLELIKSLLSRSLMRTDTVISGEKCLEMVKTRRYDVILMDYMMPSMDGAETLRRLYELPGFDTPVVALTANVVSGVREKLLDAGFCQYLSKPIRWRDLETALLAVLPKERVTVGELVPIEQISMEAQDELARELSACGVDLADGLKYVGGDIEQYGRAAAIFTDNYGALIGAVRDFAAAGDWANMKFRVHSLKGNARSIGANALSDTAAKLERLCGLLDGAYIAAALPALYLEWERAKDGLIAFRSKLNSLLPKPQKEPSPVPELGELLHMLQVNRYHDAIDALDALIEIGGASEKIEQLREIRQKTKNMEFREAKSLLIAFIEKG